MEFQDQLKRSSLGRIALVGELYDVRSESLSSLCLLRNTFPRDLVKSTNVDHMAFEYKFTENCSDRFELIDIQAELQLSVLCGLVQLEGSGKFLSEEKKSKKTLSCSLMCQIQTVSEKMFASSDDLIQHVDLNVLENTKYTHVITEINWGANCFLNLEFACSSEAKMADIKGRLAAELSKLKAISLKGDGKLEKEDSFFSNAKDTSIKVFADVVPEGSWPTSVEGFFEFVASVPKLLKNVNGGKGKPLNYTMIPLSNLQKLAKLELTANVIVRKIDESFFASTVFCFEEIGETKKQLHDLCALLKEKRQYVKIEDLKQAEKMKTQLLLRESNLKSIISDSWVAVRSGEKTLKDLIRDMEMFKGKELRLFDYEEYLDSSSVILQKLSHVSDLTSKGILYLGHGEKFETVQSGNLLLELVVLLTSSEVQKADPELHRKTLLYFLTLATEAKNDRRYVVVDFDFLEEETFFTAEVTATKCVLVKGGEILSRDLYSDFLSEKDKSWVRLQQGGKSELCHHKPGNRVTLEMRCPGVVDQKCSTEALTWACSHCKSTVEYGFDDFYYCACGKSAANNFEYRCGNPRHGSNFITASSEFLKPELSLLRPLKEMNILVIGQSGVGKSTWINSIFNYLTYDSFEEVRDKGVICVIPASFTIYDPKTLEDRVIIVGTENDNEVTDAGSSATQYSRTYTFRWNNQCVRLIDTPGLGDTRGIGQDKENLKNIIDQIGYLDELHGVCILLRANDNRITALFSYCLKELLLHLHKSVTKNIVFCFTNSRTSLYTPGQTGPTVKKVLESLKIDKELALGKHNMFCLDNEGFLFLCSLEKTKMEHNEVITRSFVESWKISLGETHRLFNVIRTFQPHKLKETLTLVNTRTRVLSLTKPLAEISKTIQLNVNSLERKETEIKTSNLTLEDLRKKLIFTEIRLESVVLDMPRTVCTAPSCVEYVKYRSNDVSEIQYRTHCHKECRVKKVTPKTVNNPYLKYCSALKGGKCTVCGCSWEMHMHLMYDQKRVERIAESKFIKADMEKEESEKKKIECLIKNIKSEVENYKKEQDIIIQASVKFGMFLRKNAITVYNDSVSEYLEYLIDEEKKKPDKSNTEREVLKNLMDTLDRYNAEVDIFKNLMKTSEEQIEEITPEVVHQLEEELYKLELTGKQIREGVKLSRTSEQKVRQYSDVTIDLIQLKSKGRKPSTQYKSTVESKNSKEKKSVVKAMMSLTVDFLLKKVNFSEHSQGRPGVLF